MRMLGRPTITSLLLCGYMYSSANLAGVNYTTVAVKPDAHRRNEFTLICLLTNIQVVQWELELKWTKRFLVPSDNSGHMVQPVHRLWGHYTLVKFQLFLDGSCGGYPQRI